MIVAKLYFSFSITDCKYTCHRRCRDEVDLDCTGGWQLERNLSVDEMSMKTLHLINQVFLIQYTSCFVFGCSEIIEMLIKKSQCWEVLPPWREFKPWDHCHILVVFVAGFYPSLDGVLGFFILPSSSKIDTCHCHCKFHMHVSYLLTVKLIFNFFHRSMNWSIFDNCRVKREKNHLCFTQTLQLEVFSARRLMNSIRQQLGW